VYEGKPVQGWPAHRIARAGIGYVPEDRRIFPGLTVRDNLDVASYQRKGSAARWTVDGILKKYEMLGERADQDGATLSGGQQQMLAVARSLMIQPRLLLLDEPNEGLAPVIVQQIGELIDDLSQTTTILFTDQSVRFALKHAQRAYILEKGQVVHEASSQDLKADQATQDRFLSVA
ncbi:ATP-binding cassette domain-containing protein, partial [Marinobacter sp.]